MESESDEDVYEVEKIVDDVLVEGKTYYRVRWKNYDEDGDTWEPRENLLSCEDLLNNYIRAQSEKASGLAFRSDVFTAGTGSGSDSAIDGKSSSASVKKKAKKQIKEKKKFEKKRSSGRTRVVESETTSESSSDEEPQVKDPFWENLQRGKIDVFASDLYSKVKSRRFPEKDVAQQETTEKQPQKKGGRKKKEKESDSGQKTVELPELRPQTSVKKPEPSEEGTKEKKVEKSTEMEEDAIQIISDDDAEAEAEVEVDKAGKNPVLQYLEKEIQNKKHKGKKTKKVSDEKETKTQQSEANDKLLHNLFETSDTEIEKDTKSGSVNKLITSMSQVEMSKNISKPNIVLEKIDIPTKIDDSSDTSNKKREKTIKIPQKSSDLGKKRGKESSEKTQKDEKRGEKVKEKETKKITEEKKVKKKEEMKSDEKRMEGIENKRIENQSPMDTASSSEEGKKSENRSKTSAEQKQKYHPTDAFSAQLQEVDVAVTDFLLKKKEKTKKHKPTIRSSPNPDRVPSSPTPTSMTRSPIPVPLSGVSVLEMLSHEMERTANFGSPSSDSKLSPFDAAVKDAHNKLGLKPPSMPVNIEKSLPASCPPDMVEFLKIKVNFELDEISVKDIERHHEMGEPPCRLERDVTNAEFRQYIKSNNFEMVHEALKSKKMMYNLEHTDSVWMTQLMVAAAAGYDEIVKVLAHHGARVNARSKIGQTALMFAAEKGHDIICRVLIAYGAYVNLQTTSGETALMKAGKNGHGMIARYLLQAGADPMLKSAHGTTALEIAERNASPSLAEMIKVHETKINKSAFECINRECQHLGIKTVGLPILTTRVYNIRETPMIHVTFNCVLQTLPPNQGLLLFAVHGMVGSGLSIKCRMRGPCHVNAVTINNFVMDAMMPGKTAADGCNHFITNLVWKTGQNSLRLFLSQDALSNEKVFITIFSCSVTE